MKLFLLILSILLMSSLSFSQWSQTSGPEGVSVSSLATINGSIYVGTTTDGIYVSTDDGVSWTPKNTGIESFEIRGIVAAPGYLFAATFGHGVYRSTDNGQTWLPPASGGNLASTGIVVKDTNLFVSSVNGGVYRSTDNGVTWVRKLFGFSYIVSIGVSGNKVFASTDSYYTLVSTDNGETWSYINSIPGFNHWCYYTEGNLILIGGEDEVYKSTDQGNTFATLPLNINYGLVNVYSVYESGSVILAATSYNGVYKSTNNGTTWSPANEGMGPKDVRALTAGSSSTFIAGSHYAGIYRSIDLGSSWSKSMEGIPPGSSILSFLASSTGIIAGTRDGMYRTTNSGVTWTKLTGTSDTVNYGSVRGLCEKDGALYAGTFLQFNSTVYKSTDHGTTWLRSGTGLPSDLTFIYGMATAGNNILAATDEGVYYSSDDGNTWNPSSIPNTDIKGFGIGGIYIYAIVESYGVYRSGDDGVSWYPVLQLAFDYTGVAAKDNFAYAGTFFNGAIYSSNYGGSWYSSSGFPADASVFAVGPVSDGLVLAGTDLDPNWIYASFNNGVSFSPYSEGLGPNAATEYFAVSDSFMFAGTDYNGVWRRLRPNIVPVELTSFKATVENSNSVALSWQTATETNNSGFEIQRKDMKEGWEKIGFVKGHGTTTNENDYSYVDKNLESGNYSYKLVQVDFDGTRTESQVVSIDISSKPTEYALMQNYPNPFNPSTTIEYSIPSDGNVKITVFNSLGEAVKTLVNGYKQAGSYKINFNASTLSSGVYYYRMEAGSVIKVHKMILLR
jgi:photosystem II stability/assembly factor-like uncharacterized protein